MTFALPSVLEATLNPEFKKSEKIQAPARYEIRQCWNLNRKSMRLVLVSDSFIPKGPWELLWLVQAHRPVFGSVKLARIKYEKSFVRRHMKSDEGLFESLRLYK